MNQKDANSGPNWSRPLARVVPTKNGKVLHTLGEAGLFVSDQDMMRQHWFSTAQALMVAALNSDAVPGATETLERALTIDGQIGAAKKRGT
jgi:hypothetical protein